MNNKKSEETTPPVVIAFGNSSSEVQIPGDLITLDKARIKARADCDAAREKLAAWFVENDLESYGAALDLCVKLSEAGSRYRKDGITPAEMHFYAIFNILLKILPACASAQIIPGLNEKDTLATLAALILLHDGIEDQPDQEKKAEAIALIEAAFGHLPGGPYIVKGVQTLDKKAYGLTRESSLDEVQGYFATFELAELVIKVGDTCHNLKTLKELEKKRQLRGIEQAKRLLIVVQQKIEASLFPFKQELIRMLVSLTANNQERLMAQVLGFSYSAASARNPRPVASASISPGGVLAL